MKTSTFYKLFIWFIVIGVSIRGEGIYFHSENKIINFLNKNI